jgi:adenylate kinase family enzyme
MATAEERKKLAAEQYLAENRIRWLLENVTADLINFTPTKPHAFIVKRIRDIQEHGAVAMHRHHLVAVVGGPTCGKGMACAHVAQELGTVTIAPAELLRNEVKDGTEMGKRVGELLHADATVPKEFITELMRKRLESFRGSITDEPTYVLDGFPRNLEQTLHFEANGSEIAKVIYLKASDAVLLKRSSWTRSNRRSA